MHKERGDTYIRAIGIPYRVDMEPELNPSRLDHVWLVMEVAPIGRIIVAINTLSLINRDAGYDPRVSLGIIPTHYEKRPEPLIEDHIPLDYTVLEATTDVRFTPMEPNALEELLMQKCNAAVRAEVWGELYIREHLGVHQIHSRRASCAVVRDIIGKDGGLRLYYRDGTAELLLFKFCGQ